VSGPVDPRVALLQRERAAMGGTIGFAIFCVASVFIAYAIMVQL